MRAFAAPLAVVSSFLLALSTACQAADCGYDKPACTTCPKVTVQICERPAKCCRPHGHHHCRTCQNCCQAAPKEAAPRAAAPPQGPIYESAGVQRMMPIAAMPMMMAYPMVGRAAYVEEAPRPRESTCASSSGEIELLKERFERLHERVNTLQQSMELQTAILEKISIKLDDLDKRTPKQ